MSILETAPLSGTRKAAILLSVLGEEAAATILRICRRMNCSVLQTRLRG